MSTLKKKLTNKIENIIHFMFPILKMKTFPQLVYGDLILSKRQDVKSISTDCFTFSMSFVLVITGFRIPFLEELHILNAPTFGSTGRLAYLLASFAICEVGLVRIWIYLKLRKCKSTLEIDFVQLILKARSSVHKKISFWVRVVFSQLQIGAYTSVSILIIAEYVYSHNLIHISKNTIWLFGSFHLVRVALHHVVILISFTFVGLSVLTDEIKEIASLLETSLQKISFKVFIHKYLLYINSAAKMNTLTRYLLFVNNVFNIPFTSMVLYSFSIKTSGSIANVLKFFVYFTAISYSFRVYILTAILSKVDRESKRIYFDINSAIARGKVEHHQHCKLLLYIIEDLACEKNHFVIREFNSSVTEMDTYNNIINTLSIAALYHSFDQLARKFVSF